jgi:hypothetical protein
MRVLQHYSPIFVPSVTCEFRDHERGSLGKSADLGGALKQVYEELHPLPHRPVIEEVRRATLASIARRPAGQSPFPPSFVVG